MPHPELGRWSWLAADPFGRFTSLDGSAAWNGDAARRPPDRRAAARSSRAIRATGRRRALPFQGGASGFFAYEAGRLFERLPEPNGEAPTCPEIDLWFHDVGIAFDVVDRRAFIVSTGWPEEDPSRRGRRAYERAEWLRDKLERAPARAPNAPIVIPREAWQAEHGRGRLQGAWWSGRGATSPTATFFRPTSRRRLRAELPDGLRPARALRRSSARPIPRPSARFIVTPERLIASTSPEGFLRLDGRLVGDAADQGHAAALRRSAARTARLAEELLASEKDRAENIMIVDLMRNDLSRVCLPGTVEVPVLCGLESYASVHHLVSVVRGKLKPGLDALHLIAACFPGGSITGAPKIRAMEIIHELEPEPRGVYCGSIVHFGYRRIAALQHRDPHAGRGGRRRLDPRRRRHHAAVRCRRRNMPRSLVKAERMFAGLRAGATARTAAP